MSPQLPARRRAERFDALVEDASVSGAPEGGSDELTGLLGTVTLLRSAPPVEARPEFVADLRERLMLAARTALAPDTPAQLAARRAPAPRRTARERRIAAAVGGLAILSATGTVAVAAQSALPGDSLYPLKRAIESAHAGIGGDDNGATLLDNASGRLAEVDELTRNGSSDPEAISDTLRDFATQADQASDVLLQTYAEDGDVAPIEELRSFAATSMAELDRLEPILPPQVRDSLIEAARTLTRIDELVVRVCPTCSARPVAALTDPLVDTSSGSLDDLLLGDPGATAPAGGSSQSGGAKKPGAPDRDAPSSSGGQADGPRSGAGQQGDPTSPSLPDGGDGDTPTTPNVSQPSNPVQDLTDDVVKGLGGLNTSAGDGRGSGGGKNKGKGGNGGTQDGGVLDGVGDVVDGALGSLGGN